MADAINDFADEVHAVAAVVALVGSAYSVGLLGTEALGEYPRVVWVSDGGSVEPVDDVGARLNSGQRIRQVRTDAADVSLHVWAADRETARALMHALVVAIWQQSQGCVYFSRYTWVTEQARRSEFATDGSKLILDLSLRLPITEAATTLTVVAAQTQTVTFTFPDDPVEFDAGFDAGFRVA